MAIFDVYKYISVQLAYLFNISLQVFHACEECYPILYALVYSLSPQDLLPLTLGLLWLYRCPAISPDLSGSTFGNMMSS